MRLTTLLEIRVMQISQVSSARCESLIPIYNYVPTTDVLPHICPTVRVSGYRTTVNTLRSFRDASRTLVR